jgi:hypothetical protein
MFRQAKIPWEFLLQMRVTVILQTYGITQGARVVDDSDKKRCNVTTRIFKAHKLKDKTSGGYINGQHIVLLLLVTPIVTIPVGVSCYLSDPALTTWRQQDQQLKKQGVSSKNRPPKPARKPAYPTTHALALTLFEEFRRAHPTMVITMVLADALYATHPFTEQVAKLFGTHVISQLHQKQHVRFRQKRISLEKYVTQSPGIPQKIRIRGDTEITVRVSGARLYVAAHHQKRFVMALTYAEETDYRYLVASDLSWRTLDIVQGYTLRWLVEIV